MHWHTVFEVSQTNPAAAVPGIAWWMPVICLLMWVIAIAGNKWVQVPSVSFIQHYLDERDPFRERVEVVSRCMPFAFIFVCIFTAVVYGISYFQWEKLNDTYKDGNCGQVEGTVSKLDMKVFGHKVQTKSFTVSGRQFTLEEYSMDPGLTLHCSGSELIKEGSKVHLWFTDSSIARVDIWE